MQYGSEEMDKASLWNEETGHLPFEFTHKDLLKMTGSNKKKQYEQAIKDIKKWIKSLRSGAFEQTAGSLQDVDGFCCLGVACKVLIKEDALDVNIEGCLLGELPHVQPNSPLWLDELNELVCTFRVCPTLSELNDDDDYGYSFEEIADILEQVFVLKVLDKPKNAKRPK